MIRQAESYDVAAITDIDNDYAWHSHTTFDEIGTNGAEILHRV